MPRPRAASDEQVAEMERLYADGATTREIAEHVGVSPMTVSRRLRERGVEMRPSHQRRGTHIGAAASMWRGGRWSCDGYVYIHTPDHPYANTKGYVAEHRLIVEAHLREANPTHPALTDGYLDPGWAVHHKNTVRSDNRIDNLEPLTHSEHHRLHYYQDGVLR